MRSVHTLGHKTGADLPRLLVNAGCGPRGGGRIPGFFRDWQQLRIDIDPAVEPDVIADITDLSPVPTSLADAVWSAHCIEHLYQHQVGKALSELHRILRPDGFACIIVPDLQTVANYVASDRLHEVIYESPAGPITAHDVLFGFGPAIAQGYSHMAHRCGFTPTMMMRHLQEAKFPGFIIRRLPSLELAVVASKRPFADEAAGEALMRQLQL
jgi:SAM-dependent methyltransferase